MVNPSPYTVGGTVQANQAGLYLSRQADTELLQLCQQGSFAYVLTPRQMGKSSLMIRTAEQLMAAGTQAVIIDLTQIGTGVTADQWYMDFLDLVASQLYLSIDGRAWWQAQTAGNTLRLTRFFQEVVLAEVEEPVVIFVDEIDTTLSLDFTDDFYTAIRYLYVARANDSRLRRLSFVLIGVATPGDLIRDPKRTPFNIGQRVDLTDFTFEEAMPLAAGLNLPETQARPSLEQVLAWTSGHPYLTQRLCQALTQNGPGPWSDPQVAAVVTQTFLGDRSDQDNNLQFVRDMLTKRAPHPLEQEVLTTYRAVYRGQPPVPDEEQNLVKSHLKLSGVVRRQGKALQVRNALYREVFNRRWIQDHLPENLWQRLKPALPLIAGLLVFSGITSGLAIYAWKQQQEALEQKRLAEQQTAVARQKIQEALNQKQEALKQRDRAQTAEQAAEAEKKKAVEASQAEAKQRQRAEAGEAEAREQASLAQQNEQLAQANAAKANEQTGIANQAKDQAQQQTLRAEIQAGAFEAENLMASGLNFRAWLAALDLSQRIRQQNLLARDSRSKANTPRSQPLTLDRATRLQAVSVLREVVYGPGWREKNTFRATEAVSGLSFSPDGQWLVSAGEAGTINRWDRNGNLLSRWSGHGDRTNQVSVSPDGRLIASSSQDGTIRVWDSRTGAERAVLQGHQGWVEGVSFSPDGQTIVSGGEDGTVRLWNLLAEQRALGSPLLQESGTLTPGPLLRDPEGTKNPWSKNTYVQEHNFSVEAGEKVLIRLDSQDFDPYLRVLNPEGQVIAQNDDRFGQSSGIGLTLDQAGTYRIQVTSYTQEATGTYRLAVRPATPEKVIRGHTSAVLGVAFSPNGQLIASASTDNTARIWDRQGNLQQTLQGHTNRVNTVSFSLDGKTLGTTSRDGTARLWNLAALERPGVVLLDTEGRLAPGPLLQDPEGTNNPWSKTTYVQEHNFSVKAGEKVLIRLDSQDFDPYLRLLDPEGQVIAQNDDRFGQNSGIGLTLDQSGIYRIQVTSYTQEATGPYRLAVTTAESEIVLRGHGKAVRSLDFSPGGDRVVTASEDATLKLWTIQGNLLQTLGGHASFVNFVRFSPDGQSIASASGDRTIKVWQPSGEDLARLQAHDSQVSAIAYAPDGQTLATVGSDGTVKLWQPKTAKEPKILEGHSGPVWHGSFAPDGQTLATAGSKGSIKLWDVKTDRQPKTLADHTDDVNYVSFTPDGQTLASASQDGTVKLWNPRTAQLLDTLTGHQGPVYSVTFSPHDQTLASAGDDRTVKLWNVTTGKELQTLEGHSSQVFAVVFSPDGGTLASAGLNDGIVKLWNPKTGQVLQTLAGHSDGILALSFAPDGQTLASASLDRTVKLWNVTTGKELQTLEGHLGPVRAVSFSPDGQTLASGDREDGTVIFWNLDLEDLMARSCGWLADYMANPTTPLEEKALCKGYLPASRPLSSWAPWHWLGQVRGFWQGLGVPISDTSIIFTPTPPSRAIVLAHLSGHGSFQQLANQDLYGADWGGDFSPQVNPTK